MIGKGVVSRRNQKFQENEIAGRGAPDWGWRTAWGVAVGRDELDRLGVWELRKGGLVRRWGRV